MLKFFLVQCIVFLLFEGGVSQGVNYLHIRDSLALLSCENYDRANNLKAIQQLENYNVSLLGRHINMYYEDLAICYWKEAGLKNEDYLRKGMQANLSALYYKPDSQRALSGLLLTYAWLGECAKARYYLQVLRNHTPKRKWDHEQEKLVLSKCE